MSTAATGIRPDIIDRNLGLELVRVTEAAAIAAGQWVGMWEKDEAPMLYNGENVGDGSGATCDVAVDPIDGTRLAALGMNNAMAVLAVTERGAMFDPSAVFSSTLKSWLQVPKQPTS